MTEFKEFLEKHSERHETRRSAFQQHVARSFNMVRVEASDITKTFIYWRIFKTEQNMAYANAVRDIFLKIRDSIGEEDNVAVSAAIKEWVRTFLSNKSKAKTTQKFIRNSYSLKGINRVIAKSKAKKIDDAEQDDSSIRIFYNKAVSYLKNKKWLTSGDFWLEMARYGAIGIFMGLNTFLKNLNVHINPTSTMSYNSFGCMVGLIPLPHVQSIEVARSGKVLKFRASGSVFLANQSGGDDAVVIKFLLVGTEIAYIMLLWALFYYCRGKITEIEAITKDVSNLEFRKLTSPGSFNPKTTKAAEEVFLTFPFVSNHVIIPNCYIETFVFEEKVVNGRNVINVSLMLRTYDKPKEFSTFKVNDDLVYIARSRQQTQMSAILEFAANIAYRIVQSTGAYINDKDLKTGIIFGPALGKGVTLTDDVYYEVDAEAIASTVALGAYGVRT